MSLMFKELDYRLTPIGPLSLRWRRASPTGADVLEIKRGEEFLMSSQFTASGPRCARRHCPRKTSSSKMPNTIQLQATSVFCDAAGTGVSDVRAAASDACP
jgi:hypothetical protein